MQTGRGIGPEAKKQKKEGFGNTGKLEPHPTRGYDGHPKLWRERVKGLPQKPQRAAAARPPREAENNGLAVVGRNGCRQGRDVELVLHSEMGPLRPCFAGRGRWRHGTWDLASIET